MGVGVKLNWGDQDRRQRTCSQVWTKAVQSGPFGVLGYGRCTNEYQSLALVALPVRTEKAARRATPEAPTLTHSLHISALAFLLGTSFGCDPGTTIKEPDGHGPLLYGCKSNEIRVNGVCVALPDIKVNTIGYLVGRVKRATVPAVDGVDGFTLTNAEAGDVVYEGTLAAPTTNADTADTTRVADFSSFDTPGNYVLRVEGLAPSPAFRVGDDVMNEPLRITMLGLYGQRCGIAVKFEHLGSTFKHAACHLNDAEFNGEHKDGTGGWHDAGDYGKYTVNAAFAVAFVLKAWEDFGSGLATLDHIPSGAGTLPAWLDEAKFQLDQILKMQLPDGSALHMIGPYEASAQTAQFPGMTMLPDADLTNRAYAGVGTAATADLAAVAAMAARVYRPYDAAYAAKCLNAALEAEAFLEQTPTALSPDFAHFTHSAYQQTQDADDRFWAQVEVWRTTGDPSLLTKVEAALRGNVPINFDWGDDNNLGMFSYVQATSDARDPAKLAEAQRVIIASADTLVAGTERNAYGRGIDQMYYWGINGVVARSALNLMVAKSIAPSDTERDKYANAALQQIDHLLGRNAFGRTFVTGLGYLPAQFPHHRPSEGDSVVAPWPGLLVGGPNPNNEPDKSAHPGLAKGLFWFDQSGSYNTNEIAINWNTALAYALAGFYK